MTMLTCSNTNEASVNVICFGGIWWWIKVSATFKLWGDSGTSSYYKSPWGEPDIMAIHQKETFLSKPKYLNQQKAAGSHEIWTPQEKAAEIMDLKWDFPAGCLFIPLDCRQDKHHSKPTFKGEIQCWKINRLIFALWFSLTLIGDLYARVNATAGVTSGLYTLSHTSCLTLEYFFIFFPLEFWWEINKDGWLAHCRASFGYTVPIHSDVSVLYH